MTRAVLLAAAVALAGCAAPRPGMPPPAPLDLPQGGVAADIGADWWTAYRDPALNALVDEAVANNRDLARAMARIDEARAALRLTRSERGPVVSAGVSAARQRASETGPAFFPGASPWASDIQATLNVAYEIDLWGRIASSNAAARQELLATEYARRTLHTALAAQVVQTYAALRALDEQVEVYRRAVAAQRESLRLNRARFDAGDMAELDWRQLEAELLANETQLPRLDRARGEAERALALLLGRSPRVLVEGGIARTEPAAPLVAGGVPEGLPADLLARRPDFRAAETRLAAAGARVNVARAAYLPSITLTAAAGKESRELSHLFDGPSTIFSVLASLTQPIWNAGALDAQRDLAFARARQAELDYRDTAAAAFKDARDAIAATTEAQATLVLTEQRSRALERASELTRLRFEGGVSSRLDAIEAERAAFTAQAQLADARRALAAAQADVFRALGGGWDDRPGR